MEDDQQFCLRWNNHQSTIIQNFDTLLESGTLVDCTLAAEGKYLKAHKVVLSACSPYFEGLLSEHYDKHPVFILKDVKFKELKAMMDYMYRGEVNISQDQLTALLKAAESLQIKGLSDSRTDKGTGNTGNTTTGGSKDNTRPAKTASSTAAASASAAAVDIPHTSSGLTIEKNSKVPRQSIQQVSVSDQLENSASPQLRGHSSREGSQSPTRKRKRLRRRSLGNDDNSMENHEASNSSDVNMTAPALGVAPVAEEKSQADPADSIGRSALMQQLTKPADEMLQMPLEKPEPSEDMIQPKSEYQDDQESVEDLTNFDDDMNDLNEMEQDNSRAGPSHDPSQHAGMPSWHIAGDRSNASVVGAAAGPGAGDEVFLAAAEAAQAQRDSQGFIYVSCDEPPSPHSNSDLRIVECVSMSKAYKNPMNKKFVAQFACIKCGKSYSHQASLWRHELYECGKPPGFGCPYCEHRCNRKCNMYVHIRLKHKGKKIVTLCSWLSMNQSLLRKRSLLYDHNRRNSIQITQMSAISVAGRTSISSICPVIRKMNVEKNRGFVFVDVENKEFQSAERRLQKKQPKPGAAVTLERLSGYVEDLLTDAPVIHLENIAGKSEFETAVLMRLAQMSNDITSVKQRQDAIPREIASISVAHLENPITDFFAKYKVKIPMTTLEEFADFEQKLKTNINFRNDIYLDLRTHIDKNDVISKSMVRMLKKFMVKGLANMFTAVRTSKVNKNKIKFKPTEFCMMMDATIMKTRNEKSLTTKPEDLLAALTDVLSNVKKWKG
ncbi:longitudinals lacking protein, isoforms N/O/W/X/Y isoform X4 [Nasonia vitripennis]|uniref:Longitudinals lacking protein n=1 Tax=Nasonia vitripennis TaxID=7425 RepID=A0A7M7QY54_NASVI|nr:longitudinals lacking protein, isoforms N/O/W/X/Y isoform X4 [Nasonia vitripennis]